MATDRRDVRKIRIRGMTGFLIAVLLWTVLCMGTVAVAYVAVQADFPQAGRAVGLPEGVPGAGAPSAVPGASARTQEAVSEHEGLADYPEDPAVGKEEGIRKAPLTRLATDCGTTLRTVRRTANASGLATGEFLALVLGF